MSKVGRNSPCPCGSGKKFKRCCIDKNKVTKSDNVISSVEPKVGSSIKFGQWSDVDELDEWCNDSLDLINEGKLEEAEVLAKKLLKEFPELPDGWERMAMIYEAQNNYLKAEEYYVKADHIVINSDGYDDEFADFLKEKANKMRAMIS
jgi:tetratricopeptide (TPR) repeat protein